MANPGEPSASQQNRIELLVKTASFQANHTFNKNNKVSQIIKFAVDDARFGLERSPTRTYRAFLETPDGNRELDSNMQIDEQNIAPGSAIVIAAPSNPDGSPSA